MRWILFLLLSTSSLFAQFRKIDMRHGLSYNSVMCLLEGSDGRLWVGTREGLNLYNGYEFQVFKHKPQSPQDLSNNHINIIYEDESKNIWIGTANGLNLYQEGKFMHWLPDPKGLSNAYVKSILQKDEKTLWVGTSNGLTVVDLPTKKLTQLRLPTSEANNIISLFKSKSGRIYLGTKSGIYTYQNESFQPLPFLQNLEIRDIKEDKVGKLWIATETDGVYGIKDHVTDHWTKEDQGVISNQVRKLLVEEETIMAATLGGMYIANLKSGTFTNFSYSINDPDGLSRGSIHDICKDKFGGYWIATYSGGLNYFHRQNNLFKHYRQLPGIPNGLSENDVNGFVQANEGKIWVSTGRGLNLLDPKTGNFQHFTDVSENGLSNRIIKALAKDKEGNLWIGTYNGLNYLNAKTLQFRHYFHDPKRNSLNQNQVHALYYDADGQLWIGMNIGDLQIFDPKTQQFTSLPGIGNIISYIYEDSKGYLWLGTRAGLKCLDRKNRKLMDISNIIRGYENELLYINWILEDHQKRIWLATQGSGLFMIENQTLHWFGKDKGLSGNTINAILEDEDHRLWISTNSGISKIEYNNKILTSTDFTEVHGLQGLQFNPGSAFKSEDGTLFFGGINGFNAFRPENIVKELYFPKVHIDQIRTTSGKSPEVFRPKLGETVILSYDQRNVVIDFAGIHFIHPEGVQYRYKLDEGWIETGNHRSINFTYLPIGKHELKIQATSQAGIWGEDHTSIQIQVLPPWWRSHWAYIMYALSCMAIISLMIREAKKRNQRKMQELWRQKEQKMMERRLEFFTDISHELRTPLTLILTPLERLLNHNDLPENVSKSLHSIQRNGKKMMEMISQVLNLRRFEESQSDELYLKKEALDEFFKEILLSFRPLAIAKHIDYHFELSPIHACIDTAKMEMILQNLLSNAFKFTPEFGQVYVRLNSQDTTWILTISNTGKKLENMDHLFHRFYSNRSKENPQGTGWGLDLCKRMVTLHQGQISVQQSEKNEVFHTHFKIEIPFLQEGTEHAPEVLLEETSDLLPEEALPKTAERQILLLVEDNREIRQMIKEILSPYYQIREATDGMEGWNMAQEISPDLIISDIMMPQMDGIELCGKLKTDPKTSHIPVILLTARATVAYKQEGYETGADAYITKPFSPNLLLVRIKNLLHQRKVIRLQLQVETALEPGETLVNSIDDKILYRTREYVDKHISDPHWRIEDMSKELGLSRMHLHRKLKTLTGMTPAEFVKHIRLKKAAKILQENTISVKEVMFLVGFEDADHFRISFKEMFGAPPSEYKKH
ncbi:hybrid sensor histidine kinase/response regulator transcription factor [Leadbetterella byssophila]|nr:two-component regulator propeller domain-containing protein [Leadbetterella byssophila]